MLTKYNNNLNFDLEKLTLNRIKFYIEKGKQFFFLMSTRAWYTCDVVLSHDSRTDHTSEPASIPTLG